MDTPSPGRIIRWGAAAAVAGGVYLVLIAVIYAVTGVGAAWDRLFGSLEPLLFPAPALFALSLVAIRIRYGNDVAWISKLALAVAVFGMVLVAIGQFGGTWLGFARSGNHWTGPGILCVELGLLIFAASSARRHTLPRRVWMLPLLMTVVPVPVIAASQTVALLQGTRFLEVHDSYFRALNVAWAALCVIFGVVLWGDRNAGARSG
jgi:hypothetical protein